MVCDHTAKGLEVVETPTECFLQASEIPDLDPGAGREPSEIFRILLLLDISDFVRAEGGEDLHLEIGVLRDFFVPFQTVDGIIRSADQADIGGLYEIPDGHRGASQLFIAKLPDLLRGIAVQIALVSEIFPKLQVGPVIERIPDQLRERLRPFLEFFPFRPVSCDILLRNTVDSHLPPLIVVSAEPDLKDVFEAPVLRDFLRVDMAVIVQDRRIFCVIPVEPLRRVRREKKIPVHKCFHLFPPVILAATVKSLPLSFCP